MIKRNLLWVILPIMLLLALLATRPAWAGWRQQAGSASGSYGDPADMYLDFTLTGADFTETSPGKFEGDYNGGAISLSGQAVVSRREGSASWVSLDANIMDQRFYFPSEGEDGYVTGRSEEISYQVTFPIPEDYPYDNINGHVKLEACGEWVCGSHEVKFVVWLPDELPAPLSEASAPEAGDPLAPPESPGPTLPIGLVVGGIAVVVVGGATLVAGGIGAYSLIRSQSRPKPAARVPNPANSVQAWLEAAQRAEAEAEKYARQWETARASGDPNDPGYQALQQQYQDYIQYQRQQAAEARRRAQGMAAEAQQHEQEVRQQQAYRRHRQAESEFIDRESQRQAQREGAFDRSVRRSQGSELVTPASHAEALANLKESIKAIDSSLKAQGVYVRNAWQGDPTYIVNWVNQGANQFNDWMMKKIFDRPSESITCQDYVDKTLDQVTQAVELHFPGAKVENMLFQEKSSEEPDASWGNWLDSFSEENHNLIKVTLPNGMAYAVDFHQHNAYMLEANKPPLVRPWNGAESDWKNYLGADEFTQSVRTI